MSQDILRHNKQNSCNKQGVRIKVQDDVRHSVSIEQSWHCSEMYHIFSKEGNTYKH